jgi:hypothetical protein
MGMKELYPEKGEKGILILDFGLPILDWKTHIPTGSSSHLPF